MIRTLQEENTVKQSLLILELPSINLVKIIKNQNVTGKRKYRNIVDKFFI